MTFPNFPKRSSSEDDALDQALNAWATERHSGLAEESPREALLNDALEFHRWADETRRTEPAATGPAASTWNRVLRSTAQTQPRGKKMSSAALRSERKSAIIQEVRPWNLEQISRYLNNAAMLVIVFGVAFAGALAAMQLNQPGGSDGQFGLFGQSDQSATCDVEPMTVDEVMAIVENPYAGYDSESISSRDWLKIWEENNSRELLETDTPAVDQMLLDGFTSPVTGLSFDEAVERANGFLACAQTASVGHVFNFFDPKEVQRIVLASHPVYRDAATIRTSVEQLLSMPAMTVVFPGRVALQETDLTLTVNPDSDSALIAQGTAASRYDATRAMMLGIVATDENGTVLYRSDAKGVADPEEGLDRQSQFRVIMKQSAIDGQWYVLATWPEILHIN